MEVSNRQFEVFFRYLFGGLKIFNDEQGLKFCKIKIKNVDPKILKQELKNIGEPMDNIGFSDVVSDFCNLSNSALKEISKNIPSKNILPGEILKIKFDNNKYIEMIKVDEQYSFLITQGDSIGGYSVGDYLSLNDEFGFNHSINIGNETVKIASAHFLLPNNKLRRLENVMMRRLYLKPINKDLRKGLIAFLITYLYKNENLTEIDDVVWTDLCRTTEKYGQNCFVLLYLLEMLMNNFKKSVETL